MKLVWKVSLLSLLMTTVTVSVCSLLLLIRSGQRSLDLTVQSAVNSHAVLAASWKRAMASLPAGQAGPTAERSYAEYMIEQYGDETAVLMAGADMIFNRTGTDPSGPLPLAGESRQYVIEKAGNAYLRIVGSGVAAGNGTYSL